LEKNGLPGLANCKKETTEIKEEGKKALRNGGQSSSKSRGRKEILKRDEPASMKQKKKDVEGKT